MKFEEKLKQLPKRVIVDKKIIETKERVRGIYGVFSEKNCIYVGKSYDICDRFFNHSGHLSYWWTGLRTSKLVEKLIYEELKLGKQIYIRILQEVPYIGDSFPKDMQRLASAENAFIDYYQSLNQCLFQVPEGTRMKKEYWERLYKK